MKITKTVLSLFAALAMAVAANVALAADHGPKPANVEAAAKSFLQSRLYHNHGAAFRFSDNVYKVEGKLRTRSGKMEIAGWATDVSVNAETRFGERTGFRRYTVVFHQGRPIALREDFSNLRRVN